MKIEIEVDYSDSLPYTQEILLIDKETGYYKVVLNRKNKDHIKQLQERLSLHIELAPSMIKEVEEKAQQNDVDALHYIAMLHIHKVGPGYDNFQKGINLLEKAKSLGSVDAHVNLLPLKNIWLNAMLQDKVYH